MTVLRTISLSRPPIGGRSITGSIAAFVPELDSCPASIVRANLEAQQPFGIAVADLGADVGTDRRGFDEVGGDSRILIGIVD